MGRRESSGDGGGGCTTVCMCLLPLNCALENGEDGKLHVMHVLTQQNFFLKAHPHGPRNAANT